MTVVGVLGASGETGRIVAQLLAEHSGATLVLFGRRPAALEAVRNQLPDPSRAEVRAVDATDPEALTAALRGVDVVVATAPLLDRLDTVLPAVLEAGVDWIDVFLDGPAKWTTLNRLEPTIANAGRCVITGCGMHPGLAAVLVRAVAPAFTRLTRADVAQLISADWASYTLSTESMTEFTQELTGFDMSALVSGRWQKQPLWRSVRVDFGPPHGHRSCAPMGLEEIRRLPEQLPTLSDAALYMAGFNPVTDWLAMPVAMAMIATARRLGAPAARLMISSLRRFSRPPFGCVAQVVAEGDGHEPVRLSVRHGEGGYWLTAAVAVATVLQYLDGTIRAPGVHIEGLVTDPARLLHDIAKWGATVDGLPD